MYIWQSPHSLKQKQCLFAKLAFSISLLFLGGCQSTFQLIPKTDDKYTLTQTELNRIIANDNMGINQHYNVAIGCFGLYKCSLAAIDETLLINDRTNKPYRQAVNKGMVYVQASKEPQNTPTNIEDLRYIALTTAGQHSVLVRLFPVSDYAYESVMVIHDFKPKHVYSVRAFRKATQVQSTSLLALAAPKPVCAVLLENEKPIRQFCKLAEVTTGLGEFVEEAVTFDPEQHRLIYAGNQLSSDVLVEIDQGIKKLIQRWRK